MKIAMEEWSNASTVGGLGKGPPVNLVPTGYTGSIRLEDSKRFKNMLKSII